MKNLILTAVVIFTISLSAQSNTKTILKESDISYEKRTNIETGKIVYFVTYFTKDMTYPHLSIYVKKDFYEKELLSVFIGDLVKVNEQMKQNKVGFHWLTGTSGKRYGFDILEHNGKMDLMFSIYSGEGNGYTLLSQLSLEKLINTLNKIDFGQDTLKSVTN